MLPTANFCLMCCHLVSLQEASLQTCISFVHCEYLQVNRFNPNHTVDLWPLSKKSCNWLNLRPKVPRPDIHIMRSLFTIPPPVI
ncbi:hypothetical protein F5B20DRAFT_567042, partial [Whalleya microplaca]